MSKELTERQRSVLDFVIAYLGQHGYPPSIREIGAQFDIRSLRGVTVHLDALERKGFIRRESTSRSIRILKVPDDNRFVSLPMLGAIAAGMPLDAIQNVEADIPVPRNMLSPSDTDAFILRVKGDSMVGAHIMDGDMVVIKPQQTAENGDLVAVLLGDEATVKRLRIEGEESLLMPANPAYQPIPLRGTDVRLIGKVIGLMRTW